ncbi:MAG: hypothetical protein HZB16_01285, partial [Armatimonadetes bacterium]|nr:hypothetical protein [Armatimonadota bacterium]
MSLLCLLAVLAGDPSWSTTAPAQLPPVTVRWADPGQQETVIVEGAGYQCVVDTLPLRLRSLSVGARSLLGPAGVSPVVIDAAGRQLKAATIRPDWDVWRGQRWQPATSGRARMNVWSAGPYYWDCHLLDIPMMADDEVAKYNAPAGPPLAAFDLTKDHPGCTAAHSTELSRATDGAGALRIKLTGPDPYIGLPPCDVPGPVVMVLRLRSDAGGGAALYYGVDGQGIDG